MWLFNILFIKTEVTIFETFLENWKISVLFSFIVFMNIIFNRRYFEKFYIAFNSAQKKFKIQ